MDSLFTHSLIVVIENSSKKSLSIMHCHPNMNMITKSMGNLLALEIQVVKVASLAMRLVYISSNHYSKLLIICQIAWLYKTIQFIPYKYLYKFFSNSKILTNVLFLARKSSLNFHPMWMQTITCKAKQFQSNPNKKRCQFLGQTWTRDTLLLSCVNVKHFCINCK